MLHVFVCNINSRTYLEWREPGNLSAVVAFLVSELPATKTLNNFIVMARDGAPDYTIRSTATLMGALLSHNNMVLQCWVAGPVTANETVNIAGVSATTDNNLLLKLFVIIISCNLF